MFLKVTGVILFSFATTICQPIVYAANETRPNIVFILSDDHRWDQLGCAGHPILKTPNLDQLANDGVRFQNMFVTTPICAASRASIFTGMYERGHKYTFGTKPLQRRWIETSYPWLLKRSGYRMGFVGKFGVNTEGRPSQIFDFFKPLSRNPYFKKQPDGTARHVTQISGDLAIQFLEQQKNSNVPFCLSISFNAPHAEDGDKQNHFPVPKIVNGMYQDVDVPTAKWSAPEIFATHPKFLQNSMHRERFHWRWDQPDKFKKNMRGYWGMISGVDHVVGRIRKNITKLNLADNTIIIFTGDNGFFLGQRGFAGKWSHYEEALRTPLIVLDPRNPNAAGKVRNEMVLNIDLAPTILDFAGLKVPPSHQGLSLKELIDGKNPLHWRNEFLCEHLFHLPGRIPKFEGVRSERWTYTRYFEQTPVYEFLHDLKAEPSQLKNFAHDPQFKSQLNAMRLRCDQLVAQLGGTYSREKFPLKNDPIKDSQE